MSHLLNVYLGETKAGVLSQDEADIRPSNHRMVARSDSTSNPSCQEKVQHKCAP